MLPDYKDFAEYIALHYPEAGKIVEVGVGREFSVVEELKKRLRAKIITVDIKGKPTVKDDVTSPRLELYTGAELIYAIRPNPELYPYLLRIARKVKADLIIRPFSLDPPFKEGKLVNYKASTFYVYKYLETL
jgi:hypothetical protein